MPDASKSKKNISKATSTSASLTKGSKSTEAQNPRLSTASSSSDPGLKELLLDSVKDIFWAENHLVKNLPIMQKAAGSPSLAQAISEHLAQTRGHVARLEKAFDLLGEKVQAKKCDAMEGLAKEGEGIIEDTEAGTPARDLGIILASQKVEHYEIATYTGLAKLAQNLGLTELAELFSQTLSEETAADEKLSSIAESEITYPAL